MTVDVLLTIGDILIVEYLENMIYSISLCSFKYPIRNLKGEASRLCSPAAEQPETLLFALKMKSFI